MCGANYLNLALKNLGLHVLGLGENRRLVADGPLSLRNNRLKSKTTRNLPIILEESTEHTSNEQKQNRTMSTCNQLDLELLGSF